MSADLRSHDMSPYSVLFTCANAQQAANAVPVARWLIERDIACRFMLLDPVYHQAAAEEVERSPIVDKISVFTAPSRGLSGPFHLLPMAARWRALKERAGDIASSAGDHNGVIAGMDGAFERIVLRRYRDAGRFTAILWDGLVGTPPTLRAPAGAERQWHELGWQFRKWVHFVGRRVVLNAASHVGLEAYVPGLGGHTSVDTMYTMGRFVTEAFRSQGVTSPIETTGIPRFADFTVAHKTQDFEPRSLIYLTSAYRWHGDPRLDRCQQRDLDVLTASLPRRGWRLRIRIHPREDESRYERFHGMPGITISSSASGSLRDDLERSDVVITAMSTGGIQALALGRPVVVYLGAFPTAVRETTIGLHPQVPVVRNESELEAALRRFSGLRDTSLLRSVLDDFIDPATDQSSVRIADSIERHIKRQPPG